MKPGDLVRYKMWPHEELHKSGMTGVVLNGPYLHSTYGRRHEWETTQVDILWDRERTAAWGSNNITWEYEDELEVIDAVA